MPLDRLGLHSRSEIVEAAQRLLDAERRHSACPPIRELLNSGTIDDAYAVQSAVVAEKVRRGAVVVGRKIGLTSRAVQEQLGVHQPDFGVLFEDRRFSSGAKIPDWLLMQPKAEAEIAFVLADDLADGPLDLDQCRGAVARAYAAIEIVDSRIANWDITLTDTVADNASFGAYVVGRRGVELAEFSPKEAVMTMTVDGNQVSQGLGSDCLGDPLLALAWLAQTARTHGQPLLAGQTILSGALGPVAAVPPGAVVEATISGLGSVSFEMTDVTI